MLEALQAWPEVYLPLSLLLGLLVGSFLNVVIYRLPLMMQRDWQRECRLLLELDQPAAEPQPFNLAVPASRCPHCGTLIKAWQNIPVVSYLLLRGRCHHCRAPISPRYPIVEAVTGVMTMVVFWQLGFTSAALAAAVFTWALIALTLIDADHQLLPDQITLPLLWLGLLLNSTGLFVPLTDAVWGAIAGYLSLWSVYWVFKLLTGKEGMGFGDFKLLAALGAWMGWQMLPLIILLSSLVGAIVGAILLGLQNKGRQTAIPFGPYLAAAGWLALFWGDALINSYLQFAGLQ